MGKRSKWLSAVKKAFSPSKDTERSPQTKSPNVEKDSSQSTEQKKTPKDKKRWSFGKSSHHEQTSEGMHHELANHESRCQEITVDTTRTAQCTVDTTRTAQCTVDTAKATPFPEKRFAEAEQEQTKHAMAVAAATAAAADAAVAAARAAAEVVRLTGAGRASFYGGQTREDWAAVKIQSAFRAYLARRALRALKGLVRLQALFRGHAVRRQTTTTLRCMQALVRVQAQVRSRRSRLSEEGRALQSQLWQRQEREGGSKFESDGGNQEDWDDNVQPPEVIQVKLQSKQEAAIKRERALAYAFSHQPWRVGAKSDSAMLMESESGKPNWGWNWLERWMASRPWESRIPDRDATPGKSMEEALIDVGRLSTNLRSNSSQAGAVNSSSPIVTGQKVARQPAPYSPMAPQTLKPVVINARSASPRNSQALDEEGSAFSGARSTPSLLSAPPRFSSRHSVASSLYDDDSMASFSTVPSYMAATESARAKFRSQSTPKQRPGTPEKDGSFSARKRLSFPVAEPATGNSVSLKHNRPTFPQRSPSLKVQSGTMKLAEHRELSMQI